MSSSPAPSSGSPWNEYTNAEGRTYWSHSVTKQSVWDKPDDLKTPFEQAMSNTVWKQYISKGRAYYVNSKTKETLWELPQDLKDLKKKLEDDAKKAEERAKRGPSVDSQDEERKAIMEAATSSDPLTIALRKDGSPLRSPSPIPMEEKEEVEEEEKLVIPPGGWPTHEAAENAFMHLLKKEGVDEHLPWEKVMARTVMDPLYKSLNTLAEKKNAWAKYTANIINNRESIKRARLDRLRPQLKKMLGNSSKIRSYSTFKTAEQLFSRQKPWSEIPDEGERRLLFDEYVGGLKTVEENAQKALRQRNLAVLTALLKQLPISVSTTWKQANDLLKQSYEWKADTSLQSIDEIDILITYEDYANQLVQEHDEQYRKAEKLRKRRARKARDAFRALLNDLEATGEISSKTTWQATLEKIKNETAYIELCGMQGSSPLDLWMDAVDDLGEAVQAAVGKVESALKKSEKKVDLGMSEEAFLKLIKELGLSASVEEKLQKDVYQEMQAELQREADDNRRRAERKRRHLIDDLRYAMKGSKPEIGVDMSYEEAVPLIQAFDEFKALDEEARQEAFDKYIKRQKEKLAERERERARERDGSGDEGDSSTSRPKHRSDRKARDEDVDMDYDGSKQRNHRDDKRERDRGKDRERERDRDRRRDDGRRSSHKHDDYEEDRDDKRRRRGGEGDTEERVVKKPRTNAEDGPLEEGEI